MGNGDDFRRRGSIFSGGYGSDVNEDLAEAREQIQRIMAGPTTRGFVVDLLKDGSVSKALISVSQQLVEVALPRESYANSIDVGSVVRVQVDTLAILGLLDSDRVTGDVAFARNDGKNGECEVDWHGNTRIIRYGSKFTPEAGDRIMVDATCNVGFRNLGVDASRFSFEGETGVTWDDIGGLTEAKATLKETFELPFQHPELYKRYGKKQVKGVMLYGPSGTGKTMLAKAVASSIRGTHGAHASGMIYVRGPEVLDKFIGQTEAQIRALFARARTHFNKHGYPAVLFIDEADALLGKRGARLNMGTETTVVPQFLSEMDGLDESKCVILLATNRSDTLDPAVVRDGRIDRKIHVTRPDRSSSGEIFRLHFRNKPLAKGAQLDDMIRKSVDFLFDSQHILYEILLKNKKKHDFTLGNLVNGAMIAGMIDNASTIAMDRDIKSKSFSGISIEDLRIASQNLFIQNLHTNHETELQEIVEPMGSDVQSIERPQKVKSLLNV